MGQVSRFLRRATDGYTHWCPGCCEVHAIYDSWTFDRNIECPTFTPSVKITAKQRVIVDGKAIWEWVKGPDGKPVVSCCHYFLTGGQLQFCGDSTHALAGKTVPLPELPGWLRDD